MEEERKGPPLEPPEGAQLCRHPSFELLAPELWESQCLLFEASRT